MVREFKLINEIGQEYSLMDIRNHCLLTNPSGLGVSYNNEYEAIGNTFIKNSSKLEQGSFTGIVNFMNYDNFSNFIKFIKSSKELKIAYKIPYKDCQVEYLKDVNIRTITKTEKQTSGFLSESIVFDFLSLWYQDKEIVYTIAKLEEEIQWDFKWDARFADYSSRTITFNNDGHVDATFKLELWGHLINPGFSISQNGVIIKSLIVPITLQKGEKLLYSSQDNNIYLKKQNIDGSEIDLFTQEYIDINNDNFFEIPKGTSEISLLAENDIYNAKLNIFKQYEVV